MENPLLAPSADGHRPEIPGHLLGLGGSEAAMEVFKEFRGREPETDALLRHCGLHVA